MRTLILVFFSCLLFACGGSSGSPDPIDPDPIDIPEPVDEPEPIDEPGPTEPPEPVARCSDAETAQSKRIVREALEGLFIQKNTAAINQYWADPYLQHNPIADSGVAAFASFMTGFVTQPSFNYELIRVLGECDLVIVLGRYSQTGLIYDMFRVQNDKLMEHWDSDTNQSSSADGPREVQDRAATWHNRERILSLYEEGLIPNATDTIASYFTNDAIIRRRTNNFGPTAFLDHLSQNNIRYQRVHHVIADGNFVFVMAEGTLNGQAFGFYDVYRLADNRIVEHWDSRRRVPSSTVSGLPIF